MDAKPALEQAIAWSQAHAGELFDRYLQLLRMPTISTDPEHAGHLVRCAEWLRRELERCGLQQCQLLENGGPPLVYGEWLGAGSDRPVVLIYAHYDVMPVDPLDAWDSSPFDPTLRDGRLYARGAIDDKCGVAVTLAVLAAMLATAGALPFNVKLLLDGEEECGSPHIAQVLASQRERLDADLLIVADGGGVPGQPLVMTSVRGTVDAEVIVHGPPADVHSGMYGGIVHNPIHHVGNIIAALHDDDGRVCIPGFYDGIRPLTAADLAILAGMEPELAEQVRRNAGLSTGWAGTLGSYAHRATALPACDVNGVWGGHQGAGVKTVIPSAAGFKISLRIVPDQDPNFILSQLALFVFRFASPTVGMELIAGAKNWPAGLLADGPVIDQLQQAYTAVWGVPARLYRAGGSVPVIGHAKRLLGIPIVDLGFGVGGNAHAPNEYLELEYFQRGITTALHFYHGIATLPRAAIRKSQPAAE